MYPGAQAYFADTLKKGIGAKYFFETQESVFVVRRIFFAAKITLGKIIWLNAQQEVVGFQNTQSRASLVTYAKSNSFAPSFFRQVAFFSNPPAQGDKVVLFAENIPSEPGLS